MQRSVALVIIAVLLYIKRYSADISAYVCLAQALRYAACSGEDNGASWAGEAPARNAKEPEDMTRKEKGCTSEGPLQADDSQAAAQIATQDDSLGTQATQEHPEVLQAQPYSSKRFCAGTLLSEQADIAFVCCLLERQQVQDIQKTAQAQGESQKASPQRNVSTIDWDTPLQTTRVLDCESTEDCRVQHALHGSGAGPRLGHRLFARSRPGELRLATTLISEQ